MKRNLLLITLFILSISVYSQTEEDLINVTLLNYIEGTSYSQTERIEKAFYPEANLYLENKEKELWVVPIDQYTSWFDNGKQGQFNGRIGNVLSIDHRNNIAVAKVEILFPSNKSKYIDMFLLKKLQNGWKIMSKAAGSEISNYSGDRILFIVSNADHYGTSEIATGNSFSEIVNAYSTFNEAGYTVDFVSPSGGSVPLAYIDTSDSLQKEYLYNPDFMYALKSTKAPEEINPAHYKAVYYVGGGGAMFGVPVNSDIHKIVMSIYEEHDGIISSVCHGTAGIVNLKTKEGKYLVAGKIISGYPDSYERKGADYFNEFPFLIQETVEQRGGTFKFSPRNSSHVEVQGNLITGQNHLSSRLVALKIIENLKNRN